MTAAHVTAMTVECPNCHQPAGHVCTSNEGYRKSIPCIARTKRANTFETSPQTATGEPPIQTHQTHSENLAAFNSDPKNGTRTHQSHTGNTVA